MTAEKALVVGATGMVGTRLVEHLISDGWSVVGLCRKPPTDSNGIYYLSVDLLNVDECNKKLGGIHDVSHVFYAARAKHHEGAIEPVEENLAMLQNIVEVVSAASPALRHVHLVHGAKYYGSHLGRYKTPAKEDDPRHTPPNFYYDQQDFVAQHAGAWNWSISRPALVYDYTPGRSRNPVSLIAAYAAISRALGLPLDYPGSESSYKALVEGVAATHLASAIVWIATTESCVNEAFNVTNGDYFRWENIWPRIATYFQLPAGRPRRLSLSKIMSDKGGLWHRIVHQHKLVKTELVDLALWSFGDFMFGSSWDLCSSTTKLRDAGFTDIVDTECMIFNLFDLYRSSKFIA
ncbi:MAG TPA: SDR family oxidoreductase [Alphaproteobacteria bacterium]|nr:MAG: hypothetical protein CFH36_01767 [Alphaproteobacteria bacterium MarineAlpha9_Bin6]PPR38636.1 MAG: hypothetical protein CFH35_01031 [Alphaproteobacteria bacterium MarineAlpha9_Bin5]HHZ68163.1 SDR family oxidoreductase [Alphaproteobacteria bacterium]HIA22747.1 SDR family oxidoreductase [Alphaproteobacteria bacterium]HIB19688.1 SDR family oxidoreductase [Alphaproteobacteria bacterium]